MTSVDYLLHAFSLLCPPAMEESLLHVREFTVRVEQALLYNRVDYVLHACHATQVTPRSSAFFASAWHKVGCCRPTCVLDRVVGPVVVLIYCLEPSHVIVRMAYEVYIESTLLGRALSDASGVEWILWLWAKRRRACRRWQDKKEGQKDGTPADKGRVRKHHYTLQVATLRR